MWSVAQKSMQSALTCTHQTLLGMAQQADLQPCSCRQQISPHEERNRRSFINTPVNKFAKLVSLTAHADCEGAPCFRAHAGVREGCTL